MSFPTIFGMLVIILAIGGLVLLGWHLRRGRTMSDEKDRIEHGSKTTKKQRDRKSARSYDDVRKRVPKSDK